MNGITSFKLSAAISLTSLVLLISAPVNADEIIKKNSSLWGTTENLGATEITSINSGKNTNGAFEVQINGENFSGITSYSLNNPARIVVDIPNSKSKLVHSIKKIENSVISSVAIIEGEDRTRATISLSEPQAYKLTNSNKKIVISILNKAKYSPQKQHTKKTYAAVDFSQGAEEQGQVKIKLSNKDATVDVRRQGKVVIAKIYNTQFSKTKRLNVTDFSTPVKYIDVLRKELRITTKNDNFEIVSYQNDNIFSIEFNKPSAKLDQTTLAPGDSKKKYSGKKLSLNFQDIQVRAVLQLIGDFTDTNVVVSDAVTGSITLRLNDVPWDQALDIILQTKGLSKQENGDVIFVAPSDIIANNKKSAYSITQIEKTLSPLQQQLIQIQYARAENIVNIILSSNKGATKAGNKNINNGLLSSRGSITVDPRTNTLIVNGVPSNIEKVLSLVKKLDIPVKQVLVDARIVSASNNFDRQLGVKWGIGTGTQNRHRHLNVGISGTTAGSNAAAAGTASTIANRVGVNLGTAGVGTLAISLLSSDFLLDLELSALEEEGKGEVISSPRVITQDGTKAVISQGKEVAYTTFEANNTAPTVQFKNAALSLDVTPKIAPNNKVDMILNVTKDTIDGLSTNGVPIISTNNVQTQVLVGNGQTVVLGGVYEQSKRNTVTKVPFLGDLPIVGRAFKKTIKEIDKSELLIFVTPKIIDKRFFSEDKFSGIQ